MDASSPTRFRVSVGLMPEAPVARLVELAREVEGLGCHRCWIYDEGLQTRDVHVTLAAVAVATGEMRLGPGITNPHTRHPGTTAAAIASLDELSGGRAFLGLGAGGALALAPLAIEPDRPITAVREMTGACRGLFAGGPVDLEGDTVRFRSARLDYGREDIEIWLAGRGPRIMRTAGELADGFNLSWVHRDTIGQRIEIVRAAGRATGRRPAISYGTKVATDDADLEAARRNLTFRLLAQPPEVEERIGFGPRDAEAIRIALAEGGPAAAAPLVKDEWVLPFIVHGTAAECVEEIHALATEHGIDEFQVPVEEIDRAEQILPLIGDLVGRAGAARP